MKNIFLLTFCLVLSISTFAQQKEIPKGANKILITNQLTATENFKLVKGILAERGIEILRQDSEIKQLSTGLMLFKAGNSYALLVYCKDKEIQVLGKTLGEGELSYTVVNKGAFANAFVIISNFAKFFGKEISYVVDDEIDSRY